MHWLKAGVSLAAVSIVLPALAATEITLLRFSPDTEIGHVALNRPAEQSWRWAEEQRWDAMDAAVGDVLVPPGRQVAILLSQIDAKDLSALSRLAEMPIDTVIIEYDPVDIVENLPAMPQLKGLAYISHGTNTPAIQELEKFPNLEMLSGFAFKTAEDVACLRRMGALRRLSASFPGDDLSPLLSLEHLETLSLQVSSDVDLTPLMQLEHLDELHIYCDERGSITLTGLDQLKSLSRLVLGGSGFAHEAYSSVAGCTGLKQLALWRTNTTPADLDALKNSTSLETLYLSNWPVKDAHLAEVAEITCLKNLFLGEPASTFRNVTLTDEALAQLGRLVNLEVLLIPYGAPDAATGKALASLPCLRRLYLPNGATEAALVALAESQSLVDLCFDGGLTEAAIQALKRIRTLKRLAYATKGNNKEVDEELRTALPELVVQNQGPEVIPPAGKRTWQAFVGAFRSGQWERLLTLCSEEVALQGAQCASLREFFSSTVPIDRLSDLPDLSFSHYDPLDEAVMYEYEVALKDEDPAFCPRWRWRIRHAGNEWRVSYEVVPVQFLIDKAAERRNKHDRQEGLAKVFFDEVSMKLSSSKATYQVGEPVRVRLELANNSPVWIYYEAHPKARFLVLNDKGETAALPEPPTQVGVDLKPIGPGTVECILDACLEEWNDLSQPGTYTVEPPYLRLYADPSGEPADVEYDESGKIVSIGVPRKTLPAPEDLPSASITIEIVAGAAGDD